MSIVTHNYGVMAVLGVIFVNIFMLVRARDIGRYRRFLTIFMPIGFTAIGIIVFTGVVMMAAKHLDFTAENIAMIIFATILIFLETKRSSKLKYLSKREENGFKNYKAFAIKILISEIAVTLSISFWMWL